MCPDLEEALLSAVAHLSPEFREQGDRLFHAEHLRRLADRLLRMHQSGIVDRAPPTFPEETTPPLAPLFERWQPLVGPAAQPRAPEVEAWIRALAYALESSGMDDLLLLMGMRRTPGSVSGVAAIPPLTTDLMIAAEAPFREGELLTTVARAWTKHVPRSQDAFWGVVRGSTSEHNRTALGLLRQILRDATWWNVYGHFQQGTVFEARIPSGHGARWQVSGPVFIGFVEPFQAGGIEAREGS
jgi:hypothetical protein